MPSRTCESIEAREIFALFEAGGSDYVAFWKVFIDDSADQKKEEFVVAGIFIGKLPAWQTFQRAWNKTCRQTPRIRYFHGKELSRLDGEFRQFRDKSVWPERTGSVAANAKKEALQAVIKAAPIVGFGMGLYVPEYEKIIATHANAKTYLGKDAFEYVLQVAMYRAGPRDKAIRCEA
jgi:hypothetical protein